MNLNEYHLPIARDGSNTSIIHSQWNVESNDILATLNKLEHVVWDIGFSSSSFKEQLDIFQKSWFTEGVELTNVDVGLEGTLHSHLVVDYKNRNISIFWFS